MTHPMTFVEDLLDFDQDEADEEVRSALPDPRQDIQDWIEVLQWDLAEFPEGSKAYREVKAEINRLVYDLSALEAQAEMAHA